MCLEFWHSQNSAYFHAQLWTAAVTHQALGELFLKCLRKDCIESPPGIAWNKPLRRLLGPEYIGCNEY